jgi:phage portal protein BeeE
VGLFQNIFRQRDRIKAENYAQSFFKVFNGYSPVFTNAPGSIYEMLQIRAAIHAFANNCGKLIPEIKGSAYKNFEKTLQSQPNPFMDTFKFIYRIATILSVNNNAFIVPIEDDFGHIIGLYPLNPQICEILDYNKTPYLRYTFANGERAAIELSRCGILNQFQLNDEFFGENNQVLTPTIKLIHSQNEGIVNSIKNSAFVRFLAKLMNPGTKSEDIEKERKSFSTKNLSSENHSGLLIYGSTFSELQQIKNEPYSINAAQMKQINESVSNYFGVSEKIMRNEYDEDGWNAFYEGKIAPFALQLSLVVSNMMFTARERAHGNSVVFTTNRLQYTSNKVKLELSKTFLDRGVMMVNEVRELWSLPALEDGDTRFIRKEYADVDDLGKEFEQDEPTENE